MFNANTFVAEVALRLQTGGIGSLGHVVFMHQLPDSTSYTGRAVMCRIAGGPSGFPNNPIRQPRIHVLVRDDTMEAALVGAQAVFQVLDGAIFQVSTIKGRALAEAEVGPYYRDDRGRPTYSLNFLLTGVPTT